jgi:hypothetical protein
VATLVTVLGSNLHTAAGRPEQLWIASGVAEYGGTDLTFDAAPGTYDLTNGDQDGSYGSFTVANDGTVSGTTGAAVASRNTIDFDLTKLAAVTIDAYELRTASGLQEQILVNPIASFPGSGVDTFYLPAGTFDVTNGRQVGTYGTITVGDDGSGTLAVTATGGAAVATGNTIDFDLTKLAAVTVDGYALKTANGLPEQVHVDPIAGFPASGTDTFYLPAGTFDVTDFDGHADFGSFTVAADSSGALAVTGATGAAVATGNTIDFDVTRLAAVTIVGTDLKTAGGVQETINVVFVVGLPGYDSTDTLLLPACTIYLADTSPFAGGVYGSITVGANSSGALAVTGTTGALVASGNTIDFDLNKLAPVTISGTDLQQAVEVQGIIPSNNRTTDTVYVPEGTIRLKASGGDLGNFTVGDNGSGALAITATTGQVLATDPHTIHFSPPYFLVTNTNDSGPGSLRQAILDVNSYAGPNATVDFNIPTTDPGYNSTTGVFVIQPLSALQTITDSVVIDGYSQPGASPNTLTIGDDAVLKIVLDGSLLGVVDGLTIGGGNSTVRGLVIDNFAYGAAIVLKLKGNDVVAGNFIGTDASGESAAANDVGIVTANALSSANTIGGTAPADRNIISGNNSGTPHSVNIGIILDNGNFIEGNYVGTDRTGTSPVGNGNGIVISSKNTIGGLTATPGTGAGNLISGNVGDGVEIEGAQNVAAGNLIGTDATGLAALPNGTNGLDTRGNYNTIGGTAVGSRNIISGNGPIGYPGLNIENIGPGTAQYNLVEGNYIGTDITGTQSLGVQAGGIEISGNYNTVGGTTAASRNVVSGNNGGISILGFGPGAGFASGTGNIVQGNYFGSDPTGTQLVVRTNGAAQSVGIQVYREASDNVIGGTTPGAGNLIWGEVVLSDTSGNVLQGNLIGTDKTGTVALSQSATSQGVNILSDAENNLVGGTTLGAGNTIAFCSGDGVYVDSGTGNGILGNSIFANREGGIGLNSANNANNNQAFPVLASLSTSGSGTTVSGTLHSVASTTFRVEFFANAVADPSGYGQGQTYLGSVNVTTDSNGNASFPPPSTLFGPLPAGESVISATATNLTTGDTSQFSRDFSNPVVGAINAPLAPAVVNTAISTSASFTDPITSTTHTAVWSWGDNTTSSGSVTETNGSGTVTGSHTYSVDGVYTVTLTVTNNVGGSGQSVFQYVVAYNPSAGFVTGGGWINSPAGAYAANTSLTGKANFGLNARYQSGATVPSGNTEFQFPAANLNFHATSYDWLVITTNLAQYQGSGTVNGAGNYGFLVTAQDNGGHAPDTFRLKIWDKNNQNAVVYDTQPGAPATAAPTTPLGGGRIQVHTNAQLVARGPHFGGAHTVPLTPAELQPIVREAIARWTATGIDPARLSALGRVAVGIAEFPGPWLGMAFPQAIWIDRDAAGYGWFIDPSRAGDAAFPAVPGSAAYGKVDLLTVVEHELGHELGLGDSAGNGLMGEYLAPGTRRIPQPADVAPVSASAAEPVAPGIHAALNVGLDEMVGEVARLFLGDNIRPRTAAPATQSTGAWRPLDGSTLSSHAPVGGASPLTLSTSAVTAGSDARTEDDNGAAANLAALRLEVR